MHAKRTVDIEVGICYDVQLICCSRSGGDVCFTKVNANVQEAGRGGQVVQLELGHIKHGPAFFFYALACFGNLHLLASYTQVQSCMSSQHRCKLCDQADGELFIKAWL